MLTRVLQGLTSSEKRSVLVLGPRQTGKSTLLHGLHPELVVDLADENLPRS